MDIAIAKLSGKLSACIRMFRYREIFYPINVVSLKESREGNKNKKKLWKNNKIRIFRAIYDVTRNHIKITKRISLKKATIETII